MQEFISPKILYDIPKTDFHLIVMVCTIAHSLMIQLRGLALKYINILEYISIPKGTCGNIDYK